MGIAVVRVAQVARCTGAGCVLRVAQLPLTLNPLPFTGCGVAGCAGCTGCEFWPITTYPLPLTIYGMRVARLREYSGLYLLPITTHHSQDLSVLRL